MFLGTDFTDDTVLFLNREGAKDAKGLFVGFVLILLMGDVVSYFHTCYFYTNVLLIVKNIFTAFHNSAHRRGTQ